MILVGDIVRLKNGITGTVTALMEDEWGRSCRVKWYGKYFNDWMSAWFQESMLRTQS
jgi:uncharacterized protein YodC (DUF2158 family)